MNQFYLVSGLLKRKDGQVVAAIDSNHHKTVAIAHRAWLTILEIFIHEHSVEAAYQKFKGIQSLPLSEELRQKCRQVRCTSDDLWIRLGNKSLKVTKKGLTVDVTAVSRETYQIIDSLFCQEDFPVNEPQINSFEAFRQSVQYLATLGLLSPTPGSLDWGDLRRIAPICNSFGFTRGTPIDRYYLDRFIGEIRFQVTGKVLEVGGVVQNRELYQFDRVTEYQTLDIAARSGVTLVGDVHDAAIIEPESLDAVVLFNVLEHCHNPWMVVQNIYHWLKMEGKCFCMVPNAQRLHNFPQDYWRPLPDGIRQLFQNFSQQNLSVYGNPLTVVASFLGIAAEELSPQELDDFHPDYPVATCAIAMK